MYARIKATRNLLKEDGIIAISIDHNELNTLIGVCDEVYGNKNRIGIITVVHKAEGRNQAKFFAPSNEFMLFYAKNVERAYFNNVVLDEEIAKTFDKIDDKGKYKLNNYLRSGGGDHNLRVKKPHFFYPIYVSSNLKEITLDKKNKYTEVLPVTNSGQERTWKTIQETFSQRLRKGEIVAEKDSLGKTQIFEKYRENQILKTHWHNAKYHAIHHGTNLVSKILGNSYFDFPKSLYLILDVLKITTSSEDIILDFFSGSATTAHATMQLNAEDGGNRKFIMVQLPEPCDEKSEAYKSGYKTIADIGKERIRRAGKKIKEDNATTAPDLDIGFRVFKVDSSNMQDVYYNPDAYSQDTLFKMTDNIKSDRTEEDLLFQVLLDWGVDLSLPVSKEKIAGNDVFFVSDNALAACFAREGEITEDFCKELAKREPLRVVFRDAGFKDDSVKINVEQIFKLASPHTEIKTI